MSFRTIAMTVLASLSLAQVTFGAEPEEVGQKTSDQATAQPAPAAEASELVEEAAPKAETAETKTKAPSEMSTEEAAAAADDIEYTQVEKIDPHKATSAEIAAYNATVAEDAKIVCRKEQLTGSHRRVKVCMTVAQKRSLSETTQRELATSGRNSSGRPGN